MLLKRLAGLLMLGAVAVTGFGAGQAGASPYYGYRDGPYDGRRYAPPPQRWYGEHHWHRPWSAHYGHHHGWYRYSGPPAGGDRYYR